MTVLPHFAYTSSRAVAGRNAGRRLWFAAGWLERRLVAGQTGYARVLVLVQLAYALLFTGFLVYTHTWPAPDIITIFLLLFALLTARVLHFLRDWTPFLLLVLGYIGLTGVINGLVANVHVGFPIVADRLLFGGQIPSLWLQQHLYTPGHARWYDYASTLLYPMHFVVPLVLAFVFWMWRRRAYWQYVSSYLLLCYAGFFTYLVYPMAPPWWAYRVGKLPPVHLILYEVHYGGVRNPIVLATQYFKPNPVAAMPSLHAGFPVLVWLMLWRVWPKWGWAAVVYPLAMSFAVVYMGEHYVIDCVAGLAYALAAFLIVWGAPVFVRQLRRSRTDVVPMVLAPSNPVGPRGPRGDEAGLVAAGGEGG